jgi:hypothetical protein
MRFLFGLILGAVLTLLAATTFNVPTHALVDKGKSSWNEFLLATGDALFEFPEATAPVPVPDPVSDPISDPISDLVGAERSTSISELFADLESPGPDLKADVPAMAEPADLDSLLAGEQLAEEVAQPPLQPAAGPVDAAIESPGMDPIAPTQTVWVPFRSQMSAQGFARRLTGKLDHPFSVDREGPGRYQVIFSYASEFERLAVLDQVQSVTGQDSE